jgi:hypothetical protein
VQEAGSPVSVSAALEELENVSASLARTPRLAQLLRFLARKYFDGKTADLTEYNIATEVFGREKTTFVASQDAIARVETHRLRKKLTAFYEGPGRGHTVQISIPLGTYTPHFAEMPVNEDATSQDDPAQVASGTDALTRLHPRSDAAGPTPDLAEPASAAVSSPSSGHRYSLIVAALLLLILCLAGWLVRESRISQRQGSSAAVAPDASASPSQTTAGLTTVSLPFRMIAGYQGAPQRDDEGGEWAADRYHDGGWARHPSKAFISRTGNPLLYRYGRDGDMAYNIPLKPGTYELHLHFMQGSDSEQSEEVENKAIFNVAVNGQTLLTEFDIVSDAMGRNTADERIFRDISPSSDGMLHLQFSTVLGTPSLCAIEILEGTPHTQLPLRMAMQPTSFTDRRGQVWRPDDYYLGGRYLSHHLPSAESEDVLPFERYGHFAYALPVDSRDRYTVTLRFVELFFGTESNDGGQGNRSFRVLCNGTTLLDDFDIAKEAGSYHVVEKTFHHIRPSAQGKLNLDFEPVKNYATVSSIEVVDESS